MPFLWRGYGCDVFLTRQVSDKGTHVLLKITNMKVQVRDKLGEKHGKLFVYAKALDCV